MALSKNLWTKAAIIAIASIPLLSVAADDSTKSNSGSKSSDVSQKETAEPVRIGNHTSQEILELIGAKLESGVKQKQLADYKRVFNRVDANSDGKLTTTEYVDNGFYLTPQARRGIFQASDSDKDGVVTKLEYVINRIITDEAKEIIQKMDTDRNGTVKRTEFLKNTCINDKKLAVQVFEALDTDGNGTLLVPEYLRVWGRWARAGKRKWELTKD